MSTRNALLYSIAISSLFLFLNLNSKAQKSALQSGPMVGYSTMKEVALWVQTKESAEVKIVYWEQGLAATKYHTLPVITSRKEAFTAHLIADQVEPGKKYDYQLWINEQVVDFPYSCSFMAQPLWQWRNDAPDFSFVAGSCTYINEKEFDRPGKPYGGDYQIFASIDSLHPDMMIWLGDNIYLREVDWNSMTGIQHRYTHTRSTPEMQSLLAHTHHYAIWDDHDFGPNDADGSFVHKDKTLAAFQQFWANPSYGFNGKPSTTGQFSFVDCDYFLMDNRYYRTPRFDSADIHIWGREQTDWLIAALKFSRAPFKFVASGGQFLNSSPVYENHSRFADERAYLIKRIREENIQGVVFLSGDRHHGEINKMELKEGQYIYDITSSPLTSRAHKKVKEENDFRVEGSLIKERHFALIEVKGKRKKRQLQITFKNSNGETLFTYSIDQPKN